MLNWFERKVGSKTMFVVACFIMLFFGFSLWGLFFIKIPVENQNSANIVFGTLVAAFLAVVQFYFGSSTGAREMRQSLQQQVDHPEPAQNVERQTVTTQNVGTPTPTPRRRTT